MSNKMGTTVLKAPATPQTLTNAFALLGAAFTIVNADKSWFYLHYTAGDETTGMAYMIRSKDDGANSWKEIYLTPNGDEFDANEKIVNIAKPTTDTRVVIPIVPDGRKVFEVWVKFTGTSAAAAGNVDAFVDNYRL